MEGTSKSEAKMKKPNSVTKFEADVAIVDILPISHSVVIRL